MKPFLIFATAFLAATALQAAQYGVIATVNDYPGTANDLRGCNADGDAIEHLLITSFGFEKKNIHRIKDGEVTTANLRKALQDSLISKVQPGDAAVFFYSGHGTQVPDLDGDERDNADESLCTVDMSPADPKKWLTDDVLRHDISRINSNRVTVILECCHSGTGTRGVEGDAAAGLRYMDMGFGRPLEVFRNLSVSTAMKATSTNPKHVLLAACASHELAREEGAAGGFFRLALLEALAQRGDAVSLEQLYESIRGNVSARLSRHPRAGRQTPQFEGDTRISLKELFGSRVPADSVLAQPPSGVAAAPPPEVTNAASLKGDVGVILDTDKTEYVAGEKMSIRLKVEKDAHLRLYYTDGEQRSFLIFPNKFHPTDEVKAGEEFILPGPGATFAFEMTYPADRGASPVSEILTAVASRQPFTDTRSLNWGALNFIECTGQNYHEMVTRGIAINPEFQPGRTASIYRVGPRK